MTSTATRWPHTPGEIPPFFDHPDRACAGKDTRLWFPEGGSNGAKAIRVCRECPLVDACAAWSLRQPRLHGVWGGLTEADRDRMRRGTPRPAPAPRPVPAVRRAESPGATVLAVRAKVAAMYADGHGIADIAGRVGYSYRTVQRHLRATGRHRGHNHKAAA